MLNQASILKGFKLDSPSGEIGDVEEFYFDDRHWTIRYLVANTGDWLTGRQVLISPYALVELMSEKKRIAITLTKQQIEGGPPLDSDKPVSRQFEESYYRYYGWPKHWGGPYVWGPSPYLVRNPEKMNPSTEGEKAWDAHLRSTDEVSGYHIQAIDGEIGHVEDFIIDDTTWTIRYLIVDTRNWWPGKRVLVSPRWIERVSWDESKVFVNISRETIQQSPAYLDDSLPTRDYETELHAHYHRPGYWIEEP